MQKVKLMIELSYNPEAYRNEYDLCGNVTSQVEIPVTKEYREKILAELRDNIACAIENFFDDGFKESKNIVLNADAGEYAINVIEDKSETVN